MRDEGGECGPEGKLYKTSLLLYLPWVLLIVAVAIVVCIYFFSDWAVDGPARRAWLEKQENHR